MIRITVLTVGKLKEKYLREGCDEYLKRLSAFSKVQVVELPESRCPADPSPAEIQRVLEQEGDSILAKIPKGARVIPFVSRGESCPARSWRPGWRTLASKAPTWYLSSAVRMACRLV